MNGGREVGSGQARAAGKCSGEKIASGVLRDKVPRSQHGVVQYQPRPDEQGGAVALKDLVQPDVDGCVQSRYRRLSLRSFRDQFLKNGDDIDLACGGSPLLTDDGVVATGEIDIGLSTGSELGKRYASEDVGIELLCTRAGDGTPTCDGRILELKGAKPLPSSD